MTIQLTRNIRVDCLDSDSNIIDVIFATKTPVFRRQFGEHDEVNEVLSIEEESIDFSRLNSGASVCDSHDTQSLNSVLGAVVKGSARVNEKKEAVCKIRLSERESIKGLVADIKSGLISNVSVGYRINEYKVEEVERSLVPNAVITRWQPTEISFVAVPADPNTKSNRKKEETPMNLEEKEIEEKLRKEVKTEDKAEEKTQDFRGAIEAERKRILDISKRCEAGNISAERKADFINSGKSANDLATQILDEYEDKNQQEVKRAFVYNHEDVATKERHLDSLANALAYRTCNKVELKEGREFAQHSLLDVARSVLSRGRNVSEMSGLELTRAALTTADFRKVLANVLNKTLQEAYEAEPQTFRPLVRKTTATDFKEMQVTRFGDAPEMLELREDAEYKYGGIGEEAETYKLKTYGRGITLSRQAIINDDLNAFSRLANMQGRSASRLESDTVWGLINKNAVMGDGIATFDSKHLNYEATSSLLDIALISKIREAFRKQKTVDGKAMNLSPTYLVVPPAQETIAEKLMSTSLLATQVKDINVFAGRFQIITDSRLETSGTTSPLYFFCTPNAIDTIEICYLRGQEGIYLDQKEDFDTDGLKFKCRLDFASKIIDWRGMYKVNAKV